MQQPRAFNPQSMLTLINSPTTTSTMRKKLFRLRTVGSFILEFAVANGVKFPERVWEPTPGTLDKWNTRPYKEPLDTIRRAYSVCTSFPGIFKRSISDIDETVRVNYIKLTEEVFEHALD